MPEQIAFRMNLRLRQAVENEKPHDEILPKLAQVVCDASVPNFSIRLDPESSDPFGILTRRDGHTIDAFPVPVRPKRAFRLS